MRLFQAEEVHPMKPSDMTARGTVWLNPACAVSRRTDHKTCILDRKHCSNRT